MSLHEAIAAEMTRYVEDRRDCAIMSPSAIASAVLDAFAGDKLEPHIEYASLEHFKNMARKMLAHRFSDDGAENTAYAAQGELFSGHLQDRYPVPRAPGTDPVYKLREALTDDEIRWNLVTLRKSADARLAHADALEAWHSTRSAAA